MKSIGRIILYSLFLLLVIAIWSVYTVAHVGFYLELFR